MWMCMKCVWIPLVLLCTYVLWLCACVFVAVSLTPDRCCLFVWCCVCRVQAGSCGPTVPQWRWTTTPWTLWWEQTPTRIWLSWRAVGWSLLLSLPVAQVLNSVCCHQAFVVLWPWRCLSLWHNNVFLCLMDLIVTRAARELCFLHMWLFWQVFWQFSYISKIFIKLKMISGYWYATAHRHKA